MHDKFGWANLAVHSGSPIHTDALNSWWLEARAGFNRKEKRGFDTLAILVYWRLWKQRNAWVFDNIGGQYTAEGLLDQIVLEWEHWRRGRPRKD